MKHRITIRQLLLLNFALLIGACMLSLVAFVHYRLCRDPAPAVLACRAFLEKRADASILELVSTQAGMARLVLKQYWLSTLACIVIPLANLSVLFAYARQERRKKIAQQAGCRRRQIAAPAP